MEEFKAWALSTPSWVPMLLALVSLCGIACCLLLMQTMARLLDLAESVEQSRITGDWGQTDGNYILDSRNGLG